MLPGIALIQFAFGTDPQAPTFLPHNYTKGTVVYTGTHDNDTSVGWFTDPGGTATSTRTRDEAELERHNVLRYMGRDHGEAVDVGLELMRLAMSSVARTCIIPMQDVLGLGTEARMNRPGIPHGNWRWRLRRDALDARVEERLRELTETYGRRPRVTNDDDREDRT
jgi:4-alpha-glucanotransferase